MSTCTAFDITTGTAVELTFDRAITAVEHLLSPPAERLYVAPGWIDIQVNGFAGVDYCSPTAPQDQIARSIQALYSTGVTRFFPTVITGSFQAMTGALGNLARAKRSLPEGAAIDLGKGRVFGPHEETSEVFDPEVVWPWLVERFGTDVAKAAMSLETSKTRIGKALSVTFPRGKKTALVDAALDELRALPGAVERKTKTTIEEHEIRAARPALAGATSAPPPGAAPVLSAGEGKEETT